MREKLDSYNKLINNFIRQVKKEQQGAFEELLYIYDPLIRSFVNRLGKEAYVDQDAEDLRQELTVVLYNAILSYDCDQSEVSFGLYAKICLNNAFMTQMRSMKKRKGAELLSLESEAWINQAQIATDPSEDLIKQEEMRELYQRIEGALSPLENKVWRLYVAGCSAREIAQTLDKSEKSVDNAVFRIRQKLKRLFFDAKDGAEPHRE